MKITRWKLACCSGHGSAEFAGRRQFLKMAAEGAAALATLAGAVPARASSA